MLQAPPLHAREHRMLQQQQQDLQQQQDQQMQGQQQQQKQQSFNPPCQEQACTLGSLTEAEATTPGQVLRCNGHNANG